MINRPRYQPPPAPFSPGDLVKYADRICRVVASTHTHTQLQEFKYAVPNWEIIIPASPAGMKRGRRKG